MRATTKLLYVRQREDTPTELHKYTEPPNFSVDLDLATVYYAKKAASFIHDTLFLSCS